MDGVLGYLRYVLCGRVAPRVSSLLVTATLQEEMTLELQKHSTNEILIMIHNVMGRIPLYYESKLGLFLWLVLPQTRGALIIWKTYKKEIDQVFGQLVEQLNKIQGQATVLAKEGMEKAQEKIKEKIAEVKTVCSAFLYFYVLRILRLCSL